MAANLDMPNKVTSVKFCLSLPKKKKLQIINARGYREKEPPGAVGRSVNWLQPLRRTVWRSSLKT